MQSRLCSDKLRVMTRDGSGCEGEYLGYLALTGSPVSGRGKLRPQRCSAFFPVDCLFGGENQCYCCCRPVECSVITPLVLGRPNIFYFLKFKCSACDCQEQNNLEI